MMSAKMQARPCSNKHRLNHEFHPETASKTFGKNCVKATEGFYRATKQFRGDTFTKWSEEDDFRFPGVGIVVKRLKGFAQRNSGPQE